MNVELKHHQEVKNIIRAAFPGYRKHNAGLTEFKGEVNINSYWDGGSKSEFALVELTTMRTRALPTASHPYYDLHGATGENPVIRAERGNVYLKALPEGYALVEAGTFCGKAATARVYLNSTNMTKLLPQTTTPALEGVEHV